MAKATNAATTEAVDLTWTDAEGGYALALDGTTLVARNEKGATLKSVPAALKKGATAERLLAVRDWLLRHEKECAATVETWMLRSLPVARTVLAETWQDPAWAGALRDLVVRGVDHRGVPLAGLLRDVGEDGAGIVTIDGESRRLISETVTIPHPVEIGEITDWREFLGELGVTQRLPQLFRETFEKPAALDPGATSTAEWSGAHFKELRHALSRCATLGFRVSGGFAVMRVWEAGEPIEARYWIGSDDPTMEAETGELVFVDSQSRPIAFGAVGPVAWSEGARMATLIAAGRVKENGEGEAI